MIKKTQEGTTARVVPCDDCPPALSQQIEMDLDLCKLLARQGLWAQATTLFTRLRDACLDHQPNTLDPFEVPIASTDDISAQLRHELERIGIIYVGQLGNVPMREIRQLRIGPVGLNQLRRVCRRYRVRLRDE